MHVHIIGIPPLEDSAERELEANELLPAPGALPSTLLPPPILDPPSTNSDAYYYELWKKISRAWPMQNGPVLLGAEPFPIPMPWITSLDFESFDSDALTAMARPIAYQMYGRITERQDFL